VERWFGELTNRQIRRGAQKGVTALETSIREFIDVTNENRKPFVWTKSADQILASIVRFAERTTDVQTTQEHIARTTGTGH